MINGNNIFISLDEYSVPFAATKNDSFQTEIELIEKSSPTQGEWREYVKGRKDWGFSSSWLVGNFIDIQNLLMIGNTYTISVYGRINGNPVKLLQGSAICKNAKADSPRGNLANGSFAFQGNGALEAVYFSSSNI